MSNGQNNPNQGNKQGGREDQKRSDKQRIKSSTVKNDPQQHQSSPAAPLTPGNKGKAGTSAA